MSDRPASAGTGYLRRNDKKSRPSQPDHVGSATVAGAKFYISAWVNEGDDGRKYFKLAFTPAEEQADDRRQGGGPMPDKDREIPF
jgi:hypothetical protein